MYVLPLLVKVHPSVPATSQSIEVPQELLSESGEDAAFVSTPPTTAFLFGLEMYATKKSAGQDLRRTSSADILAKVIAEFALEVKAYTSRNE
jgi:hypothetical protein